MNQCLWPLVLMFVLIAVEPQVFSQDLRTSSPTVKATEESSALYFPGDVADWEKVEPQQAGWDQSKLDETLGWAGEHGSTSLVILYRGRILLEEHRVKRKAETTQRYQRLFVGLNKEKQVIEDVASVQKSIVSILVGIALEKELLELDDPVSSHVGTGWSNASLVQEQQIQIKHLLSMTSGLTDDLKYRSAPGKKWRYNTSAYAVVRDCLVAASGLSVHELTSKWLLDAVGMKDSKWVPRSRLVTAMNAYGFASSARDLARVGLLMQADGKWAGKTVLANDGYRLASLRSSQNLQPNYGYLWWLNEPKRNPFAPADVYAAKGALGRRIFVCASEGLVVVRLGDEPSKIGTAAFDRELWRRIMAAKL